MTRIGAVFAFLLLAATLAAQGPPRRTVHESDCGKEIGWMTDLEAALERAAKEKKPIFWFVPTAYRTPLDRKQEVYWYMMGGPFSEPRVVSFINDNFIPVKLGFSSLLRGSDAVAVVPRGASGELAARYGLEERQFVEPGFVILDSKGELVHTVDRLLSFEVNWFGERMDRALAAQATRIGTITFPAEPIDALSDVRKMLQRGAVTGAFKSLTLNRKGIPAELRAEAMWIEGLARWFMGDEKEAAAVWSELVNKQGKTTWAARAKLELEGWGPVLHGFATPFAVSKEAAASTDLRTSRMVGVQDELQARIARGIEFLLHLQRADGSWQDSRYDFGGTDSLPNVHVAVTAIAARGLLEWREINGEAVLAAVDRALPYLLDDRNLALKDKDELIWAQVYRLEFLLRLIEVQPKRRKSLADDVQRIVKAIEADQLKGGAWRHEYPNPFATASAVLVLKKASVAGYKVTDARLDAAAKALLGARAEDATFGYGMRPGSSEVFAAGRMPLCEVALLLAGASDAGKVEAAVATSWKNQQHYDEVRNYDDHARPHRIGGFFYWYDVLGRTEATLHIDAEKINGYAERTRSLVEGLQEVDGSWIDSHELGKSYGTGMALTVLGLLKEKINQ